MDGGGSGRQRAAWGAAWGPAVGCAGAGRASLPHAIAGRLGEHVALSAASCSPS